MNNYKGFTLIEILIALTVFAVMASITSSSLYYAFNTRTRVNEQADRLNSLQLAMSIIQQDTTQTVERSVRGNDMRLSPVFVGLPQYIELTRDGNINPKSLEKRSTLMRIAIICRNHQLIHRIWPGLDSASSNTYEERVLLDNLTECRFNYLNKNLQVLNEWREQAVPQQPETQNQLSEHLPKAIQVNISLTEWGEMSSLFIIPGGLYAPNQ